MTLARHMYPEDAQYFMRHFQEATSRPFGYLLVDLKPTTPGFQRLRANVLKEPEQLIRGEEQSSEQSEGEQTYQLESQCEDETSEMSSCDDCGLTFATAHDLQRHVKRWCPEKEEEPKRKREKYEIDEDLPTKRAKMEWIETGQEKKRDKEEEEEEGEVFYDMVETSRNINENKWQKKLEKYMNDGMEEKEPKQKAEKKLKEEELLKQYGIMRIRYGRIHKTIMKSISEFVEDGYEKGKSIRMALRKSFWRRRRRRRRSNRRRRNKRRRIYKRSILEQLEEEEQEEEEDEESL